MADNQPAIQVNAEALVRKMRDKLMDVTLQNAILETALEESQGRERAMSEAFQRCVKELDDLRTQVEAMAKSDEEVNDEEQ